ncbi:hypothetical protein Lal_00018859 [Lupinus albus]|nr:hypothetical protein Lal_00018859 [Lupinus albus]
MAACTFTVSQNGEGDFQTVQEAIDAVPLGNTSRTVIRLSPGIYRQPVYVPKTKNFITLAGLCPEDTVLTWNNTAAGIDHHQVCTFSWLSVLNCSNCCGYCDCGQCGHYDADCGRYGVNHFVIKTIFLNPMGKCGCIAARCGRIIVFLSHIVIAV